MGKHAPKACRFVDFSWSISGLSSINVAIQCRIVDTLKMIELDKPKKGANMLQKLVDL